MKARFMPSTLCVALLAGGALLATSLPSFADRGDHRRHDGPRHGQHYKHHGGKHYQHRDYRPSKHYAPRVMHKHYRPAPKVIHHYHRPRPRVIHHYASPIYAPPYGYYNYGPALTLSVPPIVFNLR